VVESGHSDDLFTRARAMIAHPAQAWPAIAAEPSSTGSILQGYVFPLAIIAPVFQLAGALIFEHKPPAYACAEAVVLFLLELASLFVVAFIADVFVTSFGGTKDSAASFKWIAYASTARWVAGIFAVIPFFGWLIVLVGSLYSLYALALGTVPMMRMAPAKASGFATVVVLGYLVVLLASEICLRFFLSMLFPGVEIIPGGGR
jgi:hypothetical protein